MTEPRYHTALAGLSVLIVEDNDDLRDLLHMMLESCGMQVHASADVSHALQELDTHHVDMIISDIGLPDQDGYFFIREVRASPVKDTASIPAMALTAFSRKEDHSRALLEGFNAYMIKPAESVTLLMALANLAGQVTRKASA
jgi:CheY-like chemotaxis protein